jgi:C4-dicarboxylate transporter, DctQ subunit
MRLVLQIWGYAHALKEGSETPIAVPLIENAAAVAAKEAEALMGDPENNEAD